MRNDSVCKGCGLHISSHRLIDNHGYMCPDGATFAPTGAPTFKAVLFSFGRVLARA